MTKAYPAGECREKRQGNMIRKSIIKEQIVKLHDMAENEEIANNTKLSKELQSIIKTLFEESER